MGRVNIYAILSKHFSNDEAKTIMNYIDEKGVGFGNTGAHTFDAQEPITLVERRAFLKLPLEERRKIMARQAREISKDYEIGKVEDLEIGAGS